MTDGMKGLPARNVTIPRLRGRAIRKPWCMPAIVGGVCGYLRYADVGSFRWQSNLLYRFCLVMVEAAGLEPEISTTFP